MPRSPPNGFLPEFCVDPTTRRALPPFPPPDQPKRMRSSGTPQCAVSRMRSASRLDSRFLKMPRSIAVWLSWWSSLRGGIVLELEAPLVLERQQPHAR